MKYLILVNPSAHGGRARKTWQKYAPRLTGCETVLLRNIDEARERARTAAGFETVVAVGGDGTVNAVADGVMKNPDPSLKFGVLYAGTSPDFCRFHRIPTDSSAVEALKRGTVRAVSVLKANNHHFFCSCNLGMGANVAALANRMRPFLGDGFGTFCALLWNIMKSQKTDYIVNDETLLQRNHLLLTKMPYIAGGLKLNLPALKEEEYVLWHIGNLSMGGWLRVLRKLYRGEPCGTFRICSGRTRIHSAGNTALEYDGDPHGFLPVEVSVAERRLNLISGE